MKTTLKNASPELIATTLKGITKNNNSFVILAIGCDHIIGDCLGGIVGQMLGGQFNLPVYGTLSLPVTALNLEHTHMCIKLKYPKRKIIAIDASIGKKSDLLAIKIAHQGLLPAAAMGKKLRRVGDYSITAIVADSSDSLYNVPLGGVYKLACAISSGIALWHKDRSNDMQQVVSLAK